MKIIMIIFRWKQGTGVPNPAGLPSLRVEGENAGPGGAQRVHKAQHAWLLAQGPAAAKLQ